jgi:hypothetical protein
MALQLTDKTLNFQRSVKTLLDKGLAKNHTEIIKQIGWNKPTMSAVMNGTMNVPDHIYTKFKNVYPEVNNNNGDDYKDKYIALLEKQLKDKDERIEYLLGRLNSDVVEIKQHLNINSAYLKSHHRSFQLHRAKTEKEPLKSIEEQTELQMKIYDSR